MNKGARSRTIRFVAIILLWTTFLMAWGILQEVRPRDGTFVVWGLVALLSFLSTLVHESGHALGVRWAGGKVDAMMVFPFELRMKPWRLAIAGPRPRGDLAGYVAYAPGTSMTRRQRAVIAAAGPAAEFVLALLATMLAFSLTAVDWVTAPAIMIDSMPRTGANPMPMLLPSDAELARHVVEFERQKAAETASWLATALAVLAAGGGLANLLPFDGSDGQIIRQALFRRRRA